MFKSQNKLAKAFRFKDRIPKELTSGVVYKFQCGFCNQSYYGECVRHLNVRHIGISPLNRKKAEPKKYLTFFLSILITGLFGNFQEPYALKRFLEYFQWLLVA